MHAFRKKRWLAACLLLACLAAVAAAGVWPEQGGDQRAKDGMTVDVSHAADGYIMVRAEPTGARLKLRVSHEEAVYTYDLNGEGAFEVFPLQLGSGSYTCALYENVGGNRYGKASELSFSAELTDENAPFVCPSQYVNYGPDSPAAAKSMELCAGLESDADKLEAVRAFITGGFAYDYVRALTISENYLGDIDGCFESRMGLCQDLAALTACMLRVQGIPTQLVIGYAGNTYHAWNSVLIDGEYRRVDVTAELGGISRNAEYTAERVY